MKYETREHPMNACLKDLRERDENNSEKEGERVIIRKFWYYNVCDGKLI